MDVILHVGAHRTGTTSLQAFLERNRQLLVDNGVEVWTPRRTRSALFSGLYRAPHRIDDSIEDAAMQACSRIRHNCDELEDTGVRSLIVSEENLLGSMGANVAGCVLYPHVRFRLGRIAPAFRVRCKRVVLGIRSYDWHWTSMIAFGLGKGRKLPSAQMLTDIATQPFRWRHIIQDLASAFPRAEILVFPFETMVRMPEAQVSAMVGTSLTGRIEGGNIWLNPTRIGSDQQEREDDSRWSPFAEDQRSMMRRDYAEDIAWLKAGADGLASLIDSPAFVPGTTGSGRGLHHDEGQRSLGRTGRERVAWATAQRSDVADARRHPGQPGLYRGRHLRARPFGHDPGQGAFYPGC
jgi:hypothetical protein